MRKILTLTAVALKSNVAMAATARAGLFARGVIQAATTTAADDDDRRWIFENGDRQLAHP